MSYPPPSGSTSQPTSGRSTPQTHTLPPRPPPSANNAFTFKPRNVAPSAPQSTAYAAPQQYQAPYAVNAMPSASGPSAPPYTSAPDPYQAYYQSTYANQPQFRQAAPQIHNPFAPPTAGGGGSAGYDAEYQQQLQQWQSQFAGTDYKSTTGPGKGNANNTPLGQKRVETPAASATTTAPKQQTVVRSGGGESWEDSTLLEWGNHHRIFVGNLAGEVTDESLLKAFAKYPSVQKARVVRDKRTTKSKGFGFVSFADADEYFQAAKEMNNKYIGSHPVLIRRSQTDIKAIAKKDDRGKHRGKGGNSNGKKDDNVLSAHAGGGVKKGGKVEGKYKVLG